MKPSCQTDTNLLIQTHLLRLTIKIMTVTTDLKKTLNLTQGQTSVEPITNPNQKTQQNPWQNHDSSYSESFTGEAKAYH